jgi:hypothetical protein
LHYESFNEKQTYGFRMAKGMKGFPKDFMGRLVKVFSLKRGKRKTCSTRRVSPRSTQAIIPLLAMVFGGGYRKA